VDLATNTHPARRSAGFTLVELLYVLVIVGILVGVAAPMLDVDRFRLNSAVIEMATELMAAQRSAILRGHNVVVAIDQSGNRLRVHTDENNDGMIQSTERWKVVELPDGVAFGLEGAPKLLGVRPPFNFKKKQGTYPSITFHRNGSASESGLFYLTGTGGGARANNSRAVEVIRSSAKVRCWSYDSGSWLETC